MNTPGGHRHFRCSSHMPQRPCWLVTAHGTLHDWHLAAFSSRVPSARIGASWLDLYLLQVSGSNPTTDAILPNAPCGAR